MLKPLDPFRFVLIAVAGWMNQQQLQVIDHCMFALFPCNRLKTTWSVFDFGHYIVVSLPRGGSGGSSAESRRIFSPQFWAAGTVSEVILNVGA
jgi:hypothetical protein